MEIGINIQNLRKTKGVTQEQLAKAIGVSAPAVSKWETGQSYPDIQLILPIARYLDVTPDQLLSYQKSISEEDVDKRIKEILTVFSEMGHAAGLQACEAIVLEYPNNQYIKIKIAGMYTSYIMYIKQEDKTQEHMEQFHEYALKLLLDIQQDKESKYYVQAKGMAACYYLQKEKFDQAEACLNDLPKLEINTDSLYPTLYLCKQEWQKAKKYSKKNLVQYGQMLL